MRKLVISFIVAALLVSIMITPGGGVHAQGISIPAEINKSFSPISIPSGGTSRLSVTIFNPNDFALTNASWTDNLNLIQTGLQIADPASVTNSCGGTVNASPGGTSFSLSGGTVPAQSGSTPGRCTVSLNITSTRVGNLINRIPSGALSSTGNGETVSNTDPASATLNVTGTSTPPPTPPPPPPVALSKSFNPTSIGVGGTSQLSIVIRNNQTNASLTQASVTDNLPANVFLADPVSPVLEGCGAASVAAAAGGTAVTLNNGTIAPSSTCTIRVNVTSSVQGTYTNRIPAGSLRTQENLTNPTDATARLTVRAIDITKAFDPGTIGPGGVSTLTIRLVNPTSAAYTGAQFTDNLPSPLVVAAAPNVTNTCGGTLSTTPTTTIALTGGVIPAGSPTAPGTCTITVQVTVPAGTTSQGLTNTIPRGALTTDQGATNGRAATDTITVRGTNPTATKSFSPATMAVGENSRLRIDFFAPGDTNLTNFSITDNLPAGVTISNSTAASASGCGPSPVLNAPTGGTSISLTGGLVLAGQRCRITVYVTSSTPGAYTNTIPPENITNTENRVPGAPITSNLTVNTAAPSNLSIALVKGFDPLIVTGGAASTMSIQLINPETTALTGIAFTDNMPDGMILAAPVNFNVGTCGGTLTGAAGAGSFSFSGGSLPAQGTCTLTLSATMQVNGNLTNTIPARSVSTTQGATNLDPAEASLTNLPGASVSKDFAPNPIPANSVSLLTITILNTGNIELVQMGMSDSLPAGLAVAGAAAPAPVNNCGGTLTAVPGTQLIELTGGTLAGNSSCSIVVGITGSTPGDYQNTIPVGGLVADPNTRNTAPATATLTITGGPGAGGTPPTNPPPAGGGGGAARDNNPVEPAATTNAFLIPVTGFKAHVETDLSQTPRETYTAAGDVTLEIPSLKVKIPIVGVPKRDGTWNVAWLGNAAGWLEGSAFPSWKGNSVLTSHVYLANGLPGPFVNLNQLKFGDKIFVYAYGERYTFDVQTNAVVAPNDRSVMKHEDKPWLTLITCKDYDEKTDTYKQRVVIRAVLVEVSAVK